MREPFGCSQPGCPTAVLHPKCAHEAMRTDSPLFSALWAARAHHVVDSQNRRRQQQRSAADETNRNNEMEQQQHRQQPKPAAGQNKKREWWRLDPNTSDKYRPVEPPSTPDPTVIPTLDRIVFGWEAPMSPLEQVLQNEVRRYFPKLHEWIVRRAVERAGLVPPPDATGPAATRPQSPAPPPPGLADPDLDPDNPIPPTQPEAEPEPEPERAPDQDHQEQPQ